MKILIKQLKREHVYIRDKFTKANELGIGTDKGYAEAWGARNVLISHLLKEDELLYPALLRAAENNDELQYVLVTFDNEIKDVGRLINEFYSGYTVKTDSPSMADKFIFAFERLKSRMKSEEDFLFNEFLKLNNIR